MNVVGALANNFIVFKETWHKADSEPHAQEHYLEMLDYVKNCRRWGSRRDPRHESGQMHLLMLTEMEASRGDLKDARKATAKVLPFFKPEFLQCDNGIKFKDSLIFNQD